tara:strand:+ start:5607 stop:7613 length:2007 start_codon:yes stop_codon:yes gene_type:complete
MKKTAILFFSLASAIAVNAQGLPQIDPVPETQDAPAKRAIKSAQADNGASTTVWSEDFANGIPTGWSQIGTPATAQWEYRGPSTAISNATGSRGAFSGINNTPPTNDPLASTTTANGFMIFDSDYLDNTGSQATMGMGTAPAPHTGRLFTDVIDLSLYPQVELSFETYARRFQCAWFVAFSIDGGVTYNDTIEFFSDAVVAVNSSTLNGEEAIANVSGIIGGQSNVVMQFIFDGTPGNANGNGYYFWMIDDIELRTPPANQMFFTTWNGAPAHDMIYNSNGAAYPKYGIMNSNQIVPVEFDSNILNYGTQAQTNVNVEVEIWDVTSGSPSLVTTLSAPGCPTLASGDTCNYNDLTTPTWTPPAQEASYLIVYKAVSDTITSALTAEADTFSFFVNDVLYSTDRNRVDNYVGTNSATSDIIAMGVMYSLENEDPLNAGSGFVYIDGVSIELSAATDSTADIEIAFFDTTGFAYNAGFPAGATAAFRKSFTLNSNLIGGNAFFDLSSNGQPLALPANTYLMIVNFFPNATDGVIRIANDASFDQPGFSTVMQLGDGNWYGGFTGPTHEGTFIRLEVGEYTVDSTSIAENELAGFSVYPVPSNGNGYVEFDNGGDYTITVLDMVGKPIFTRSESVNSNERINFDITSYPAGVYLVNIKGENTDKTVKITVQ